MRDWSLFNSLDLVANMNELEEVIEEVGGSGWFQKRLLYFVLGPVFVLLPLAEVNELFVLNTPDHWCNHAMQNGLDYNETQKWKECFLPSETKPNGQIGFSSCKMYKPRDGDWTGRMWTKEVECPKSSDIGNLVIDCPSGWSFSQENFVRTAVTDNEWVCQQSHVVPYVFSAGLVGALIGLFTFNFASDVYGRKVIMWIAISMIVIFGLARTFISNIFWLFVVLKVAKNTGVRSAYSVPFSIQAELVDNKYRSWSVGCAAILWTCGMGLLSLAGWLLADWKMIIWVCVSLLGLTYLCYPLVPESPRYLLRTGKVKEAAKVLKTVARVNGKEEPKDLEEKLTIISKKMASEKSYGYLSLFTKSRLRRKTMLLAISSVASGFIYDNLVLNVGHMTGGLFTNLFVMSVMEAPANYLAVIFAEKLGRRWSHCVFLFANFLCLLFNGIFATNVSFQTAVRLSNFLAKFNSTASFAIVFMQVVELYPTCIRNTGIAFRGIFATFINISGPHVVHLSNTDVRLPYLIMSGMCLVGGVLASFLPETAGSALPETLAEADEFGEDQEYFSWNVTKKKEENQA